MAVQYGTKLDPVLEQRVEAILLDEIIRSAWLSKSYPESQLARLRS